MPPSRDPDEILPKPCGSPLGGVLLRRIRLLGVRVGSLQRAPA